MQIKKGNGIVNALEIPDALAAYNAENNVIRARLLFSFVGNSSANENDLTAALLNRVGNNSFSLIIDISDIGLQKAQSLFVGKTALFTVISFSILELTENNYNVVNNGEREYSNLSSPHVGDVTDTESVYNTLRNRLSKDLESGRLFLGKLSQQPPQQGGQMPPQGGQMPPQGSYPY